LEAARRIHDVASDHSLADSARRHRRFAREHARPDRELLVAQTQLAHARDEIQRRAHCPLCVVLARDRRTPQRHHGIADELLDAAAVALDHVACDSKVTRQKIAHLFWIVLLAD
jgi:hypothetical protein